MRLAACVVGLGAILFAALGACVGDDPGSTPGDGDGGASSSSSSGTASSSGGACRGDEPNACGASCTPCKAPTGGRATCTNGACGVECDAPAVKCGETCAVVASDGEHCGTCDHSCGGGVCLQNVCQPTVVMQGLVGPRFFDVSDTKVIVTADGANPPTTAALLSCDLPAGCGNAAPKKLAEGYKYIGELVIVGQEVFWLGGSDGDSEAMWLRKCDVGGCPLMPTQVHTDTNGAMEYLTRNGDALVWRRNANEMWGCTLPTCTPVRVFNQVGNIAMTTDGTSLFFTRPRAGTPPQPPELVKCALGALCASPTVLVTPLRADSRMTVHKGVVYRADTGELPINKDGYVYSASAAAPGTQTPFAREERGPVDVVADDDGVYWVNTEQKTVRTCPLTGCVGTPRELAVNQADVKLVKRDAKFVYWLTSNTIYKVAK